MTRLKCGDLFPDFQVTEAFAGDTTISNIMDGKKTMFVVLRYIGCTVCRYDVHCLQERIQEFRQKDVNVCVIMQSEASNVRKDLNNEPLPFALICDTDMNIYHTLEINPAESMEALVGGDLEKLQAKGEKAKACGYSHGLYEGNEQQLPAFFYVDSDRRVLKAHYGTNIMDMPSVSEMVEMI